MRENPGPMPRLVITLADVRLCPRRVLYPVSHYHRTASGATRCKCPTPTYAMTKGR